LCVRMKCQNWVYVLVAALIFGLMHHTPNMSAIPIAFFLGIVFCYLYSVLVRTGSFRNSFWIIVSIHFLLNAYSIIVKWI
jgi:membrane protease YdiL (CAAX protease family)